jgi:hypothetical protein
VFVAGPLYGTISRPPFDKQRPTFVDVDPPRARSARHRAATDVVADPAPRTEASLLALDDTHRPNRFLVSSPLVNAWKNLVLSGASSTSCPVCVPDFHALHRCTAFVGVDVGSAA